MNCQLFSAVLAGLFLFAKSVAAQTREAQPASPGSLVIASYIEAIGKDAPVYSGSEAITPRYRVNRGFPYFKTPSITPGKIWYDGFCYDNLLVAYDIVNNQVIVNHPDRHVNIAVLTSRITAFSIGDHDFIPLDKTKKGSEKMADVFYEVLHRKNLTLLARRFKKMSESILEKQLVTNYSLQNSEYFLLKDGQYFQVKSPQALLSLLNDRRDELIADTRDTNQKLREQKAPKEDPESAMIRMVTYYESLKP